MDKDDAKFYWAIIGDSSPEPVAVVGKIGARWAYTLGCPDPFAVDAPDANIQLIPAYFEHMRPDKDYAVEAIRVPMKPAAQEAERIAAEERLARDHKRGIVHGYAGFGRRAS